MQTTLPPPEISVRGRPGDLLKSPEDVARLIVTLSNEQVAWKEQGPPIDVDEFRLACDAFNLARITLRVEQDFGTNQNVAEFVRATVRCLCEAREYDVSEFDLAIEATQDRPRYPYGINPLELACDKARRNLLQLKAPMLSESKLAALIATIALELQTQQGEKPILLPVEHLRRLLHQRKLLIGGAIKALIRHNILSVVDPVYHPRKARGFRFIAKKGLDFDRRESRSCE
jgi:hypothetical protein